MRSCGSAATLPGANQPRPRRRASPATKFRDSARRLLRLIVGTAMSTLDYEEEVRARCRRAAPLALKAAAQEVETPDGYRYEGLTMEVSHKLCGIALTDVAGCAQRRGSPPLPIP